jgi:hypothetical protein
MVDKENKNSEINRETYKASSRRMHMTTENSSPRTVSEILAASRAKLAEKESATKATRAAQQAARVILADGMSELAKVCRRVVTASGENAEERIAQLVLDLAAVADAALSTK